MGGGGGGVSAADEEENGGGEGKGAREVAVPILKGSAAWSRGRGDNPGWCHTAWWGERPGRGAARRSGGNDLRPVGAAGERVCTARSERGDGG
jgi:hypothetical protein